MRPEWALTLLLATFATTPTLADDPPTYERDVRPLLRRHCTICHSARKADNIETSGGLVLDSFDAIGKGLKGQPVAVSGKAAVSPLFLRLVDADEEKRMPKDAEPLEEAEHDLIRR